MLIKTLGTSHGDPTEIRFNSSTLYEICGSYYLVDCGEPCDALMIRSGRKPQNVKAVFITHMHDDHTSGLAPLCKEKYKYKSDFPMKVMLTEEAAIPAFKGWLEATHIRHTGGDVEFDYIKPNTLTYDDGDIKVTSYRTNHVLHGKFPSFSYIIEGEGKKILHTGDLECDFSDFPKIALEEEFDACVCELTHYNFEKALPIFQRCKFKKLIFSHIGNEWHIPENVEKLKELCNSLPYPAILAFDGDEFEI
ncbi:MAG: MBL fold metallo-hydrolase [Clostridia bacterium]|nr:MBL fold metallo-hydrolase [Clostridia bacterium]